MIKTLGVQAFTFRNAYSAEDATEASLAETFRKVKALGYDEVQTAGFGKFSVETYAKLAHDAGITIVGTHYNWDEMLKDPDEAMRIHEEVLGTKIMGIGGMPGPARTSKENLMKFIDDANALADKVSRYGFKFTYHNHHFEFVKNEENKTLMDYLVEGLNPETTSFVLDTHWVQRGGGNPTTWVRKLAGRIDILHLKDMKVVRDDKGNIVPLICEIGAGNIDFDSVIEAAEATGVKYYCVEQDTCPGDPLDSLKFSADYIKAKYMK